MGQECSCDCGDQKSELQYQEVSNFKENEKILFDHLTFYILVQKHNGKQKCLEWERLEIAWVEKLRFTKINESSRK